jgi:hypothetical protein
VTQQRRVVFGQAGRDRRGEQPAQRVVAVQPRDDLADVEILDVSGDPLSRLFAAAIATRLAEDDPALLRHAARVRDEEVRSFAQWQLGRLEP